MKPTDPKEEPHKEDPADVNARIERALAPYKDLVPPEDLQFMREMLELYANSHPDVATLIDGLRKRPTVNRSTDMARPGIEDEPTAELPQAAGASKEKPKPSRSTKPGRR
jgi:hypothetical protein